MCHKNVIHQFQFLFIFLIINVKIINVNELRIIDQENVVWKKLIVYSKGLSILHMQKDFWFTSNFEHWNFTNNGAYPKNYIDNQIIVYPLCFFKNKKNTIL
jgi:hypothetical protein